LKREELARCFAIDKIEIDFNDYENEKKIDKNGDLIDYERVLRKLS